MIAAMSILFLTSSREMGTVRRRDPSPVFCRVRTFQSATTRGRCFADDIYHRVLDKPVAAADYPGKVEQIMPLLHWRGAMMTLRRAA